MSLYTLPDATICTSQIVNFPISVEKMKDLREVLIDPTQNLFESLNTNSFARIRSALQMPCINLNFRDPQSGSQTLLMRLCTLDLTPRSRRDLMRMVLDKPGVKIDPNTTDESGMTALSHACCTGDETLVRIIASESNGVDPNIADNNGDTPLMHACRLGKINATAALLACFGHFTMDVNQANNEGITPLMEAARNGFLAICRMLVTQGLADVSLRDNVSHCNALDFAIDHGRCSTPDLLLLSPVAQRKIKARHAREAMGRSILNDFYPTQSLDKSTFVGEGFKPIQTSTYLQNLPLGQEYIQQMNSIVFQVGKNLRRLVEENIGENHESNEKYDIPCKIKPRRRRLSMTLPEKLPTTAPPRRNSFPDVNLQKKELIRKSSPSNDTTRSTKPLKLPRVPDALPTRNTGSPKQSGIKSPKVSPKVSPMGSPRRPKSAQLKEQKVTRSNNGSVTYTTCSVIKSASSDKTSWGGKASNTVPSYLFR